MGAQSVSSRSAFDVVLVADCMWNQGGHEGLLQTLRAVLLPGGEVWMAHCHHWPGHEEIDRTFFTRAKELGFNVEEVSEFTGSKMDNLFSSDEEQVVFVHRLWLTLSAGDPP